MTTFTIPREACVGILVPPLVQGPLRSVHRAVINVELSDAAGPFLVSIIRAVTDWTEYAVLLPDATWEKLRDALPSTGSSVSLAVGFESERRRPQPAALPLSPADLPSPSGTILPVIERVARSLARTDCSGTEAPSGGGDAQAGVARDGGFLPLILPGAPAIETLSDPFLRRAAAVLHAIGRTTCPRVDLSPLVGLGIGLTPSGDDFISGALLTDFFLNAALLRQHDSDWTECKPGTEDTRAPTAGAPHLDTDTIGRSLTKTTSGGATLLRLALGGTPPAYQLGILEALLRGQPHRVLSIACSHGYSSGLDTLTGVIWMARHVANRANQANQANQAKI